MSNDNLLSGNLSIHKLTKMSSASVDQRWKCSRPRVVSSTDLHEFLPSEILNVLNIFINNQPKTDLRVRAERTLSLEFLSSHGPTYRSLSSLYYTKWNNYILEISAILKYSCIRLLILFTITEVQSGGSYCLVKFLLNLSFLY